MRKYFTAILLLAASITTAQTPRPVQPYGKVDMADMELKACDFEPDANAEVLFDVGSINSYLYNERHVRIKIFNDFGKNAANIRIVYFDNINIKEINDLQAETINLENGKIVITPLDKKLILEEKTDRIRSAKVFTFPNVKAGSIIEYKYKAYAKSVWYFQSNIPTRYSEIKADFPANSEFKTIPHVKQPFVVSVGTANDFVQARALANVHSLPNEPYMSAVIDNLERVEFSGLNYAINTWPKIGELVMKFSDQDNDFSRNLTGEDEILKQAKTLRSDDEKISFIFSAVKTMMKWNGIRQFFPDEGTARAWDKKIGNSAELNIITYELLKKAGIKAFPMVVSTKGNGKLNPAVPSVDLFDNMVVYIPVDSTKYYVLDATNKYNLFNQVPESNLNSFGLSMDQRHKKYDMVFLENEVPAMQSVFIKAEIKPDGKMAGTAEITSPSYHKIKAVGKYKTDGEEKYIKYLSKNDNNLRISSIKMDNMDIDTLPVTQKVDFSMELTGSDEHYIIFNTNLFSLLDANPFLGENRYSDIDFGYNENYSVNGLYKIPAGYKSDALPKSMTIVSPDESIVFRRIVIEDEGTVLVKYIIGHKKTIYFREDYQDLRGFYKRMYELMNEQIVLKKS